MVCWGFFCFRCNHFAFGPRALWGDHSMILLRTLHEVADAMVCGARPGVCDAVACAMQAYLHECDIIHGDLCGGNILLTSCEEQPHRFTCKVRGSSGVPRGIERQGENPHFPRGVLPRRSTSACRLALLTRGVTLFWAQGVSHSAW